ncbi:multicomponent Na+:H+ antiporter subunit E [Christiangramia echinicola]|uniref:Multicomponent Na+:H+ antiporter subunit E n=2 Tax=Christiangramia echinicola TaxID=279359 RepID=A0A1H1MDN6_9FLAO|nr:multicomponent Na+:H+ antiporter subunit E [Christiangramia echinicola]
MMKNQFLSNILLTFVWVALTGDFSIENYIFGFFLNFHILWLISVKRKRSKYFLIVPKVIILLLFFLYELIKANLEVAYEVITPKLNMTPGIVMVPLDVKSDIGITVLANMISLTPGTLSLDVSNDKKVLFVHAMYIKDKEKFIRGIKDGFERRILEVLS